MLATHWEYFIWNLFLDIQAILMEENRLRNHDDSYSLQIPCIINTLSLYVTYNFVSNFWKRKWETIREIQVFRTASQIFCNIKWINYDYISIFCKKCACPLSSPFHVVGVLCVRDAGTSLAVTIVSLSDIFPVFDPILQCKLQYWAFTPTIFSVDCNRSVFHKSHKDNAVIVTLYTYFTDTFAY